MENSYEGGGDFEWDPEKARRNLIKRQVSFEEAVSAFREPLSLSVPDPAHSGHEERLI